MLPKRHPQELTPRERQILGLIGEGKSSKEIAGGLALSVETVSNHRKSICRKLKVHSTAELVAYAAQERVTAGS